MTNGLNSGRVRLSEHLKVAWERPIHGGQTMSMNGMATLAASVCLVALATPAQAQERSYNIPAGSLRSALDAFGRQSGKPIIYKVDEIRGLRSSGYRGNGQTQAALDAILAGTGFTARIGGTGAVAIVKAGNGNADTISLVARETASSSGDDTNRALPPVEERAQEEIVVIGTNIRGVYPESSPIQVFSSQDIERTGATTTEQFIGKIPQNFGTRSQFSSTANPFTANTDAVSGVDLRGLGIGTTLVLLNGRRLGQSDFGRTADVSLIPLSAVDRVEVLTDGASAIYGTDAVGGVVNFVLRKDFDGAETRASFGGVTKGGLQQGDISQTFGKSWNSGHGLVSYNFFKASALENSDRSYSTPAGEGFLTPSDKRHNLLATFSQDLGQRLTASVDLGLAVRDVKNVASSLSNANLLSHFRATIQSKTKQYFANLGMRYRLTDSLNVTIRGTYSEADVKNNQEILFYNRVPQTVTIQNTPKNHKIIDLTGMIDGSLIRLPGGALRFSIGAGLLEEDYVGSNTSAGSINGALGRRTKFAFGEFFVPLVGAEQAIPFVHRLELHAAARYTGYEETSRPSQGRDFGSGIDPHLGLIWAPTKSLSIRGTYGTSFRAPSLVQLDGTSAINFLSTRAVPATSGPISTVITLAGNSVPELKPERAETYTVGFDFSPVSSPRLKLSATYYRISYTDRIAIAPSNGLAYVQTPALYPDTIYRPPSAEFIENALRASTTLFNASSFNLSDLHAASLALFANPNVWIYDNRTKNIALSEQDGLDVSISNRFPTSWGEIRAGLNATKIFSYKQQVSENSAVVTLVDTALQPVDLRVRGFLGLSHGNFDGTLNVNYVDDYTNTFAPGGAAKVDSWTTADLNMSYQFGAQRRDPLRGLRLTLSVQNLFDKNPPFLISDTMSQGLREPLGYDPTNANPLGRLVVVGFTKRW